MAENSKRKLVTVILVAGLAIAVVAVLALVAGLWILGRLLKLALWLALSALLAAVLVAVAVWWLG